MAQTRSSRRLPSRERRGGLASLAVLLYGALVLGAPGLHLCFHDRGHDHLGGGLRLHGALLGDHPHDHGHPHAPAGLRPAAGPPASPAPAPAAPPAPAHGDGSVVHFALGLLPAPALPAVPLAGVLPEAATCPAPPARPAAPPILAPPPARGPPAARSV